MNNSFIKNNPKLAPYKQKNLKLLEEFIKKHSSTPVDNLWNKFVKYWGVHQSAVNWIDVFENEYRIFNYKISNSSKIDDIETELGTSQLFGDYSFYGLNGSDIRSKIIDRIKKIGALEKTQKLNKNKKP